MTYTAALFYRRRFARIYPAYLVVCLIAFVLLVRGGGFETTDLAALTLMQNWVPSEAFYMAGNAVFWSLSCEAFFYLTFPAIRTLTRRMQSRGLVLSAGLAAVVSMIIAGLGALLPPTGITTWWVVVLPISRLPEFVIGVTVGTLMARGWRPRISVTLMMALSAGAVVVAVFAPRALSYYAITLVPFTFLIVSLAASDLRGARIFTRWAPVVKMGVWSYCFYLVHALVLWTITPALEALGVPVVVGVLASLIGGVVVAWLLHITVERPFERWLRPKGRPRLDNDAGRTPTSRASSV